MSARVNLLPREVAERQRGRRAAGITAALLVLWLLVLGGLYLMKLGDIDRAEEEREVAQAEVSRLQARLNELEEFRVLALQLEARNALLRTAMEREISFSQVMNDISLAFPPNASLTTLSATAAEQLAQPGEVDFGPAVGSVVFTGYSVERYAPGVESVLLELARVPAFFGTYLDSAVRNVIGTTTVTEFTGSAAISDAAYTRRYAEGLPPEGTR